MTCESQFAYYEMAARVATDYSDRVYGLDTVVMEKLELMGPFALDRSMSLDQILKFDSSHSDIIDLHDL